MTLDEVLHLLKEDLPQYNIKQKHIYDEIARKTRKFKNRSRIWHIPREFKTKDTVLNSKFDSRIINYK